MIIPDLIFVGDIHVTDKIPICRTDDYIKTLEKKFNWLTDIQTKYQCPIITPGDLFENWKPSPELLSWCAEFLPDNIFTIPGNHDLPAHNLELLKKSGLSTLAKFKKLHLLVHPSDIHTFKIENKKISLCPFPWKAPLAPYGENRNTSFNIAICHTMVYKSKLPWEGCIADSARAIMRKLKGYDLILTGDNHQSFAVTNFPDQGILINPGSFTRTKSDQLNHRPCIYLWNIEGEIEKIYIPIEKGVISKDHIISQQEKIKRESDFTHTLLEKNTISSSFEDNMKIFFEDNKIEKDVQDLTWECLEK